MREIKLDLASVSTAKTYRFLSPEQLGGWACITVNDATGELSIQSDWGSWSHRWDVRHLGGGDTLTQFLAGMRDVDYVSDKLHYGREREGDFDAEATVVALRLAMLERHDDPRWLWSVEGRKGRDLWDDLWELTEDGCSAELFLERLPGEVYELITQEPYEFIEHAERHDTKVLNETILPALFAALRAEAKVAPAAQEVRHA